MAQEAKLKMGGLDAILDASPKHCSTVTLVHCSCPTIKDFAVQAEMVAVETSIDVGNILWIFYDCL